jgi:hypothetical protein
MASSGAAVESFDQIFTNVIGGSGWWQWRVFLLTVPFQYAATFPVVMHLFTTYIPKHRNEISEISLFVGFFVTC